MQLHWVDQREHERAWASLVERRGAGLSLVDWNVLFTAQSLNAAIFTFDSDFRGEGTEVLP